MYQRTPSSPGGLIKQIRTIFGELQIRSKSGKTSLIRPLANASSATIGGVGLIRVMSKLAKLVGKLATLPDGKRGNKKVQNKQLVPPEADGGWPLIGHLRLLSGVPDLPHIILSNMADDYGPVFTIRLGVHRALIVSSWEAAKDCFTTNDTIFFDRPKHAAFQHMGYDYGLLGLSAYGSYWRELRKITVQNLLSGSRVAMLGGLFETQVTELVRGLYDSWKADETAPLELSRFLGDMTLKMMVRLVAGDREKIDRGEYVKLRGAIKRFFKLMAVVTISDVVPFLKWLDYLGGTNKGFKETAKEMDSVLEGWLDDNKKQNNKIGKNNEGFMAQIMAATSKVAKEFPAYGADTITKATCETMMLGGTDTMTVTLTWALSLLLNNRHTLERAQHELDLHIGRERQVKTSDIEKLVYIQSIIKETLRLYPPSPLNTPRVAASDCTVAGYHVPAGTRLIINFWKLHRDPRVWADPLEFKPERFVESRKKDDAVVFDVRGQHFEFIPFGCGKRVCPGISFALQLMGLALASLLHGFDIKKVSDEDVDMTGSLGSTNMKAAPLEVRLTPRLSPSVYSGSIA
ncbi:hypothetical protein DH2020_037503 [Rehmannia glutinosa]|uniref:Cytochrome P450 protein n=1 Tax=Rehmannia glutinosa TaxID=99300 RepID=A0ABR0V2D1_REHGL